MVDPFHFAELLNRTVRRSGYTSGQLSKLTGLPKATIVNWLEGRVKRPRESSDIVRLLGVLHISVHEATDILQAAGHPGIEELVTLAERDEDDKKLALLSPWLVATESGGTGRLGMPAPFQAIPDLPTFIGRTSLLDEIKEAILSQSHLIYALYGMAGAGKTSLAARLAYQLRDHFPDGVLWARADTSDTMSILITFAAAYGESVTAYADLDSRSRVVRDLLASRRALLVLDSVQSSEQVEPLLPPTGRCAVLLTTRRRNLSVLRGARRFLVGPFNDGAGESMALFEAMLGAGRVAAERAAFEEMGALLGHLPLAVDIAASRLAYEPGWSAARLLARLRQEQRRLRELAFEEQSVRLSLQASFAVLEPPVQRFLAACSVMAGEDFDAGAAAAVAEVSLDDAEDWLRQLHGLSLVQRGRLALDESRRFRLHPLVRDFARQQLAPPAQATVMARMVATFVVLAEQQGRDSAQLALEQENIAAALAAAAELVAQEGLAEEMPAFLVRGILAIYPFWEGRGSYDLAETHLRQAAQVVAQVADPQYRPAIWRNLGRLAERRGQPDQAEAHYETGLALARRQENKAITGDLLRSLGVLVARRGDYALAEAYYQEGLALTRGLGQGTVAGNLLRGLGVQAFMRGDYARAEALVQEGLALAQQAGTADRDSGLYWAMGLLAEDQGDLARGMDYLQQSLALARQSGLRERVLAVLHDLGLLAAEMEEPIAAQSYLAEGMALARRLGHAPRLSSMLAAYGDLLLAQGDWLGAEKAFMELLWLNENAGNQALAAEGLFGLAQAAAAQGDLPEARLKGQTALRLFQAIGHERAGAVQDWRVAIGE